MQKKSALPRARPGLFNFVVLHLLFCRAKGAQVGRDLIVDWGLSIVDLRRQDSCFNNQHSAID